jgi:tetratricopeptide (TPR) repeat protein
MGEALRNLRRPDEAVESLTRALDHQNAILGVSPQRIWNLRVLSRTWCLLGAAQLERGDPDRALDSLQKGLAVADRMLQRAPSSLPHQLDRADLLEAIGKHYSALARRRGTTGVQRAELLRSARSHFEQSLSMWQSWTKRNLAAPYAARRESQAVNLIASINPGGRIGKIR